MSEPENTVRALFHEKRQHDCRESPQNIIKVMGIGYTGCKAIDYLIREGPIHRHPHGPQRLVHSAAPTRLVFAINATPAIGKAVGEWQRDASLCALTP